MATQDLARSGEQALRNVLLALTVAGSVILCVVWSGLGRPLPALGWAAAFLFLMVEEDVRRMRIPNWLTLPALLLAIGHAGWFGGLAGVTAALAGAALGFALLLLPFAVRWIGAGDVKAVMVLGALWGAGAVLGLIWWMIVIGGALGVAILAARGGLLDAGRRWLHSAALLVSARKLVYFGPEPGSAATGGLPLGVAIGLGVAAYQLWGAPWA